MTEIDSLKNLIASYQHQAHLQIDSLNSFNQTLSNAQHTIDRQSQLISGFGTLYTALTGVLAFVTILVPVLTYFFAIRPSRKAIKKMKKIIDKRVGSYLEESKSSYLENILKVIESEEINQRNKAISDLGNNHDYKLSEFQIAKVIAVYERLKDTETNQKFSLLAIISNYPSIYVNDFMNKVLARPYVHTHILAYRYAITQGYINFLTSIIKGINDLEYTNRMVPISVIFNEFITINSNELFKILNDERFVDQIEYSSMLLTDSFINLFKPYNLIDEYLNSKFYKIKVKPNLGS